MYNKFVLNKEVSSILNTKPNVMNDTYELIIHTEKTDLSIKVIESYDVVRDFNSSYSDYRYIDFHIPRGDFLKIVYPERENLEATLILNKDYKNKKRYKLIITSHLEGMFSRETTKKSLKDLNQIGWEKVTGQLVQLHIEGIRALLIEGVFRDITPKKLLNILPLHSKNVKVGGLSKDITFNLIDPDNTRKYDHIIIPPMKLVELPYYLQEKDIGVYNGNLGWYFTEYKKDPTIFIYPLYNIKTHTNKFKMFIYKTPDARNILLDNTFAIKDDIIKIVTGEDVEIVHTADNQISDKGVGYVSPKINNYLHYDSYKLNDIEVNLKRQDNNIALSGKKKKDGVELTNYEVATDNLFKVRSDILLKKGSILNLTWRNCYPDVIYPAMPVTYVYLDKEDKVQKVGGVLQNASMSYNGSEKRMNMILSIFLTGEDSKI